MVPISFKQYQNASSGLMMWHCKGLCFRCCEVPTRSKTYQLLSQIFTSCSILMLVRQPGLLQVHRARQGSYLATGLSFVLLQESSCFTIIIFLICLFSLFYLPSLLQLVCLFTQKTLIATLLVFNHLEINQLGVKSATLF